VFLLHEINGLAVKRQKTKAAKKTAKNHYFGIFGLKDYIKSAIWILKKIEKDFWTD
jgi:hypothetical protein